MRLRTKLFINFGIILFLAINLFSYIIIKATFNSALKKTIDSSFSEYEVIYSNIKTGEKLQNLFLTNNEILKVKSKEYLNNNYTNNKIFQFRDSKGKLVYSSSDKKIKYKKEIYNVNNKKYKYMILNNSGSKYIVINRNIVLNGADFSFTYLNNISELYKTKDENISNLIKLNVILGLVFSIILYLITIEITKPIQLLIYNINKVVEGKYNQKINQKSSIKEIDDIYNNFNLMNDEIQNRIKDLENENKLKQRFINNLTHEIRTPLTSIIGYSSLMLSQNITDEDMISNSFETINNNGKRILSLTSNLAKLITLNKNKLNIEKVSMISLINEIENSLIIKLNENKIHFFVRGGDYTIKTDKSLLIILISNFLDNAIKAVSSCEMKNISILLSNNKLIIEDSGIGISKSDIKKIFEPFYMVDTSRDKSINGFGLGLSISNEIMKILNIDFDIQSELGEGTKISLLFNKEVEVWERYLYQ